MANSPVDSGCRASNAALRAVRKRMLRESLKSGYVSFGDKHIEEYVNPGSKGLGYSHMVPAETKAILGTPWPISAKVVKRHDDVDVAVDDEDDYVRMMVMMMRMMMILMMMMVIMLTTFKMIMMMVIMVVMMVIMMIVTMPITLTAMTIMMMTMMIVILEDAHAHDDGDDDCDSDDGDDEDEDDGRDDVVMRTTMMTQRQP